MSAFGTKQTFVKAQEVHAAVYNQFTYCRLVSVNNYRDLRQRAFVSWKRIALVSKQQFQHLWRAIKDNLAIPWKVKDHHRRDCF